MFHSTFSLHVSWGEDAHVLSKFQCVEEKSILAFSQLISKFKSILQQVPYIYKVQRYDHYFKSSFQQNLSRIVFFSRQKILTISFSFCFFLTIEKWREHILLRVLLLLMNCMLNRAIWLFRPKSSLKMPSYMYQ